MAVVRRPARVSAALLDTGTLRLKRTRHGLMLYPGRDEFVGRSLDLYGEWSRDDAEIVAPFLHEGATVVDAGACFGTFALSMARAVGPGGRVIAFEPVQASFRLLVANLALNDATQVEARQEAVGARAGHATIPILDLGRNGNYGASALSPERPAGHIQAPPPEVLRYSAKPDGEPRRTDGSPACFEAGPPASPDSPAPQHEDGGGRVRMVALDDLSLASLDLLKADVEGHELAVLQGADHTLRRCRPVLLLENEEPSLSGSLIDHLLALDYRLWWHAPPLFRPDNTFGCRENVFPTHGSLNLLCLPAEAADGRVPARLIPVRNRVDWPEWWPDWSRQ